MGRILAIDYGKKRIGLAVTDELQLIASPFDIYHNNHELFGKLKKLHSSYRFEKIVIGLPYSETYQEATRAVMDFAENLKKEIELPIEYQNEEFSSIYAESLLKSTGKNQKQIRESIDKYAAYKILNDYLKSNPNKN